MARTSTGSWSGLGSRLQNLTLGARRRLTDTHLIPEIGARLALKRLRTLFKILLRLIIHRLTFV